MTTLIFLVPIFLLLLLAGITGFVLAHEQLSGQRTALDTEWRALDNTRRVRAVFLHARLAMRDEALRAARTSRFGHHHHDQEGQQ
jgi:hypothetical protein